MKDFSDVLDDADTLLRQAAAETGERAVDRAKAAARVTDDYVRDNPWQALGAAAALGFLIGVLISRR